MTKIALMAAKEPSAAGTDDCVITDTAKTFHDAVYLLDHSRFDVLFLDTGVLSQYGATLTTGLDIMRWLADRRKRGLYVPPDIRLIGESKLIRQLPVWAQSIMDRLNERVNDTTDMVCVRVI